MKCHGCGVEKDQSVLEVSPWAEEDGITDEPIPPIFTGLEVQPTDREGQWKTADVCHLCFHKLEPDMWTGQWCWEAITLVTPFDQLPNLEPKK